MRHSWLERSLDSEAMGSHRRSGGDVIRLRFALCTFEIQFWRLQAWSGVARPGWGGSCDSDPGEQKEEAREGCGDGRSPLSQMPP